VGQARDPEIHEDGLDLLGGRERGAGFIRGDAQGDIAGFDIPVDHTIPVCVLERVGDPQRDLERGARGKGLPPHGQLRQVLGKGGAGEILHDKGRASVNGSEVVDLDDIRVAKACRGMRFLSESIEHFRGFRQVGVNNLHRNQAVEPRMKAEVDIGGATLGKELAKLHRAEPVRSVPFWRKQEGVDRGGGHRAKDLG
jgi:hypothetical protein